MHILRLDFDWNAFGGFVALAAVVVPLIIGGVGKLLFMKEKLTEHELRIKHMEENIKRLEEHLFND